MRRGRLVGSLEGEGFEPVAGVFSGAEIDRLIRAIEPVAVPARGGIRNLLALVPEVRELAFSGAIQGLVERALGRTAVPVRAILFDKTREANWKVPWHQDLTVAVARRVDVAGFGAWSVKAGVVHVQPPVEILEQMIAVRVHLDSCGKENGALRVIPGSHGKGRFSEEQISSAVAGNEPILCCCDRGDVVLMRPLLLHSSSACRSPLHRRVIHIEYCSATLPGGLEWAS